jgi:hypothetical protein
MLSLPALPPPVPAPPPQTWPCRRRHQRGRGYHCRRTGRRPGYRRRSSSSYSFMQLGLDGLVSQFQPAGDLLKVEDAVPQIA